MLRFTHVYSKQNIAYYFPIQRFRAKYGSIKYHMFPELMIECYREPSLSVSLMYHESFLTLLTLAA